MDRLSSDTSLPMVILFFPCLTVGLRRVSASPNRSADPRILAASIVVSCPGIKIANPPPSCSSRFCGAYSGAVTSECRS
eukprot:7230777-Prymnesium_polylepis.1